MHYVYILKCNDEGFYIGCASNLKKRIEQHKKGDILATDKRRPIELYCYFAFKDKYTAYNFEKYLKTGSGRAFLKRHFIAHFD